MDRKKLDIFEWGEGGLHVVKTGSINDFGGNMDGGMGFHSTGRAECARDKSSPLTIGMNGATKEWTK